ncbi:Crp/Fnr family transcriptional regulator [Alteromonas sp. 1_MG-2023]|uniref:Crp/Fnr family transcriptional regulator n=1 Tax=Alteromonas sp. 1_MG-2023 TaxID=3062669 RepID=UPI0026E405A1|nr:Crp/Fnr family transcriptional regulator [Alteromonas sp. 1_MG-2023]MDO6474185.1 Crp/Fnr family transcriptional regulator [Alteromonas sp. 1_MG-2023]
MDKACLRKQLEDFFGHYQSGIDWSGLNLTPEVHVLPKGETLFRQGDCSSRVYFLNTGLVRYYSVSEEGKEYTQTLAKAPRIVGSTRAMTMGLPAQFSIEALQDSVAISFHWPSFFESMKNNLAFMQAYALFLTDIFISKEEKESMMVKHSATHRYVSFCSDFPELNTVLTKQQIASYLGITPVALSRIRARLNDSESREKTI